MSIELRPELRRALVSIGLGRALAPIEPFSVLLDVMMKPRLIRNK